MIPPRVAAPLAGVAAAAVLYPATLGLDTLAREGQLGPGFWPRLALLGLALACVAKAIQERRWAPAPAGAVEGPPPISRARLAGGIGLIVAYALAAPSLGFALATAVFVAAFIRLAGLRSRIAVAASAVGGTIGLLYVFVKLVYLPLPKGDGPFEALTLALYRALRLF